MYLDAEGNLTDRSVTGHLAAGVPGSGAAECGRHQRLGSLPWSELLQPAVNLADGFVVHERLARSLQSFEERLRGMPAATTLLPDDRAQRVGDRLVQRDLADTLHRIALEGRDGFYRGHTADLIEAEMRRGWGLISHEDLARYEARWRDPMVFTYRDHWVVAMPPSSSGGATLGALLRVLEGYDLRALGHHSPEHVHLWR